AVSTPRLMSAGVATRLSPATPSTARTPFSSTAVRFMRGVRPDATPDRKVAPTNGACESQTQLGRELCETLRDEVVLAGLWNRWRFRGRAVLGRPMHECGVQTERLCRVEIAGVRRD